MVELFVETPTKLTARQKELMRELAGLAAARARTRATASFAGKAKRFWADILGAEDDAKRPRARTPSDMT